MSALRLLRPTDAELAARYRAEGLWDSRLVADGIEAAAASTPDRLALSDAERGLSYRELAAEAEGARIAAAGHGIGVGEAVVLVSGNRIEGVVAYHALLRLGAVVVLLDRRCGAADLDVALDALPSGTPVILPSEDRERLTGGRKVATITLERLGGRPSTDGLGWSEPDRDAPAVVLFTSGTTSRPKGVVHSLNTLTVGAANMARITGADGDTVVFLVSPMASITGVMQMHLVADQHAALVLEDDFDPDLSLARLDEAGATLLGGAPVIVERLIQAADRRGDGRFPSCTLALGGSMLPRPLLEKATGTYGCEIARVYGSSEAPNFTGSLPTDDPERRLLDDGSLMPRSEVRVGSSADPREALLRGPGLFLGYLDPADDAASFQDDWYRTGDLVDVERGRLTVVGRLKEIVNRNGLKISLAEIDAALADLPGAVECAAFSASDPATGERVVVAVVPDGSAEVTFDRLLAHLSDRGVAVRKLPEELVVWAGPLPRTSSGKVVRPRLLSDSAGLPREAARRLRDAQ